MAGYYMRFVEDFAWLDASMTKLIRKDVQFNRDDECEKSLNELKRRLTTAPVLIIPDYVMHLDIG